MLKIVKLASAPAMMFCLNACGTTLPTMSISHPQGNAFDTFVEGVAQHVRCELGRSVKAAVHNDAKRLKVLQSWAAKIALNLKAVDETNINPSLSASSIPMEFVFNITGQLKADSTREMTMTYFLLFDELIKEPDPGALDQYGDPIPCDKSGLNDAIAGNLGIDQTIRSSLRSWDSMYVLSDHVVGGPYDTISHHVTFAIVAGGTATPAWKFTQVSINPSGTFFNANRTTSDDLVITMGPTQLGARKADRRPQAFFGGSSDLDQSFFLDRLKGVLSNQLVR